MYKVKLFGVLFSCILFTSTVCHASALDYNDSVQSTQTDMVFVDKISFRLNIKDKTAVVLGGSPNTDRDGEMRIPAFIEHDGANYEVTEIANEAFSGNWDLYKLIIEGHLNKIGSFAFNRTNLQFINMHHGVDAFGEHAFLRIPNYAQFLVPEDCAEEYAKLIGKPAENPYTGETYFFSGSIG